MDKKQSKYITVSYQLYSIGKDGTKHLEEKTEQGRPFQFISGFGVTHETFEEKIVDLQPGDSFDFTLTPEEAFGEYNPDGVHKVARENFAVNGHFDHENIYPGAVITILMGEEEQRQMAMVTKVEEDGVTLDTNPPLAGKSLQFIGLVLENREATIEEIQTQINRLCGEGCGCGCGCDDCGDGCCDDHHHGHDDGCGCGHCHH